ncbi:MAG: cytochrome c peroxidase, partial [Bacteroidales bacterium]
MSKQSFRIRQQNEFPKSILHGGITCFFSLLLVACQPFTPEKVFEPDYFDLQIPTYFPNQLSVPSDNRLSIQGVLLGRYLFYEGYLSGRRSTDSLMCCASCHLQSHAFESGMDNPYYVGGKMRGLKGGITPHSMLPLINVAFNKEAYGWNGAVEPMAKNIEDIVKASLTDPNEIAGNLDSIVARIASIPLYPPLFEAAFGSPQVTVDRICKAIAQFVRTLVSSNSRFDRYTRGEITLTDEEMKGYILFTTEEGADCFHCHGGSGNVLFSTYACLNNGLDVASNYSDPYDRFFISKNPKDKGSYRVPSLRNIEYTAPYMHDGRFTSLEQVIDQYSEQLHYSPNI